MRIHVEAYGCTHNTGEARAMSELLLPQGHDVLAAESEAYAHLLVTCAVVETTVTAATDIDLVGVVRT